MSNVNTNVSSDADPKKAAQETPTSETAAAMNEYYTMKEHPEQYKQYTSFEDAINEVLNDDA